MEVLGLGGSPCHSPSQKRRQSPSPRRRLSTGRIHESLGKSKSPSRFHSFDGTLPVRLPHSQQLPEAANQLKPCPQNFVLQKAEPTSEDLIELLPNICSCLLGLCGCGCGLDICSILPKICSFLAGLCGSLNNSGVSSGQNNPTPIMKVCQIIITNVN